MPRPTGYTNSTYSSLTGFKPVDSIISGTQWQSTKWYDPSAVTSLTYSFMVPGTSVFAANYSPVNEYNSMYALTAAQQSAVISALSTWSAVANITFQLTGDTATSVGDLRFGGYSLMDDQTAAWAYLPSNAPDGGDVWIGPQTASPTPGKGSYDYLTFVHEIGHAIGLKHPFSPNAQNSTVLDASLDDVLLTVMSYTNGYSYEPTTPMLLDILAIQSLYGANNQWMTGNNVYSWAPTQSVFETIWDAGGIDTIDGSNQLSAVRINLNEGQFSQIGKAFTDLTTGNSFNQGLAIAYGAKIENATGSVFDDSLIGNDLDNTLNGGTGADTMTGGAGNDSYVVDNFGDVVIELAGAGSGTDLVYSYIDYTLGANLEGLILVGNAINGVGNELNNTLRGNDGDNILDGRAGADQMFGGLGNDTYIVDNSADIIVETSTQASEIDTVRASVNYALSANLENLYLTGTGNIYGIGNAQDNLIVGNDGNNQLVGGAGLDTMIGGKGNDAYDIDQVGELALVQEFANEGTDSLVIEFASTVQNVIDMNRTSLLNIEDVVLVGAGVFTVYGNALNNTLTGNSSDNTLNGGLGADIMIGGTGNDSYVVDNIGDVVIEQSASPTETDSVYSYIDYTLGANLENLNLVGTAVRATGNELNNILRGNDGDNVLIGGGGLDTMIGGKGNDTYGLDQAGELNLVQELANEGTDSLVISYAATAQTSVVNLTISNLQNFENVTLTGAGVFTVYGNSLNNTLIGNNNDNTLNGGEGADIMVGGTGNDSYVVDNAGDVIIEQSTSPTETDSVYSYIDYTLGANLENLNLVGNAISATGNELNNILRGTDGNNILDGGAGADLMIGGLGNDTYIVDNLGDVISETSTRATEIDTVRASVNYTLGANLENLTLTGTGNIYGIGNAQDNIIIGNDGNNQLVGGAGLDTMIGGKGDDAYGIDQEGELNLIQESANEGKDLLVIEYSADIRWGGATIDLNRTSLKNIEDVVLTNRGVFTILGNDLDNTLTGNADDNTLNGGAGADTMIGGAGNDSYVVDNVGDVIIELGTVATEIDSVYSYINYKLGANLENLNLVGNAVSATGNELNNILRGTDGDNILDGGLGADLMIGGKGNDTYIVDNIGDVVSEDFFSDGIDTVRTSINYKLGDYLENLTLTGTDNIYGIGNDQKNIIIGNDGDNQLVGGRGIDTMIGGKGNDAYDIDDVSELALVQELANEGTDLLVIEYNAVGRTNVIDLNQSNLQNFENVTLVGPGDFTVLGNALSNTLKGNSGDNTLDGGAGADVMIGGTGNDTYIVDNVYDVISETSILANEIDSVRASVNYSLGANLENLTMTGTGNIYGIGNAQDNVIIGNDGDNQLVGGAGLDTMIGGKGNDAYDIDQVGELTLVKELANEGTDLLVIQFSATEQNVIDLNQRALLNIEGVALVGKGNFTVLGNAQNNTLTGNSDDNTLNGGSGADIMIGGKGNDSYVVDNVGDVVIEQSSSPTETDSVYSYIDYKLGANLENLNLVGTAISATGNELNNILRGNAGNNILDGGAGTDTLFGDAGADTFVFSSVSDIGKGASRDVITDFNSLQGDKIDLTKFDSNLPNAGFDRGFTFIGANEFTGAGQVRFADHVLSGNVSGGTGTDFEIQLVGVNTFSATDLVA